MTEKFNIRLMKKSDFSIVSQIDFSAFKRDSARSIENIQFLNSFDPNGCFVAEDETDLAGFVFSRSLGNIGYFGPIAVLPDDQKKGIGKKLIKRAIQYLRQNCNIIGIEVRPESSRNLGFYYGQRFKTFLPTLIVELPKRMNSSYQKNNIKILSHISEKDFKTMVCDISDWTKKIEFGLDFSKELEIIYQNNGFITVAYDNQNNILGFMAYETHLSTNILGAIKPDNNQIENFYGLLYSAINNLQIKPLYIALNSRYELFLDALINLKVKFIRSYNRMILFDEQKEYQLTKQFNGAVFKAWMG